MHYNCESGNGAMKRARLRVEDLGKRQSAMKNLPSDPIFLNWVNFKKKGFLKFKALKSDIFRKSFFFGFFSIFQLSLGCVFV